MPVSTTQCFGISLSKNNPYAEGPELLWEASLLPGESTADISSLLPSSVVRPRGYSIRLTSREIVRRMAEDVGVVTAKPVIPLCMTPEFDSKQQKHVTRDLGKAWPPKIVVALSGGKVTTAILLKLWEEGIPVHSAVFYDEILCIQKNG